MPDIPGLYNTKIIHLKCGKIAYYHIGPIIPGSGIWSINAVYPNGKRPRPGDLHKCYSCGESINMLTSNIRQELRNVET